MKRYIKSSTEPTFAQHNKMDRIMSEIYHNHGNDGTTRKEVIDMFVEQVEDTCPEISLSRGKIRDQGTYLYAKYF